MIKFKKFDHILVCVPMGQLEAAVQFYKEVLELKQIPGEHPNNARWFELGEYQLHLREEAVEIHKSERHPAFVVDNLPEAKAFLEDKKLEITYSTKLNDRERCFFRDPWSNRFELIEFVE